jgi:hypothetical protein
MWRRDEDIRIESAASAERFIEDESYIHRRTTYPTKGLPVS